MIFEMIPYFFKNPKAKIFGIIISLAFLYAGGYIWFREQHREISPLTGIYEVIFPTNRIAYYFFRPASIIDNLANHVGAHIGPHATLQTSSTTILEASPDGKYVAYKVLDKYIDCCGGFTNIPFYSLWIMKSDGSSKVKVEIPSDVESGRWVVRFNGWYPDSSGIQYFFQAKDEATQASAIYRVGVDGKHPVKDPSAKYPWEE